MLSVWGNARDIRTRWLTRDWKRFAAIRVTRRKRLEKDACTDSTPNQGIFLRYYHVLLFHYLVFWHIWYKIALIPIYLKVFPKCGLSVYRMIPKALDFFIREYLIIWIGYPDNFKIHTMYQSSHFVHLFTYRIGFGQSAALRQTNFWIYCSSPI